MLPVAVALRTVQISQLLCEVSVVGKFGGQPDRRWQKEDLLCQRRLIGPRVSHVHGEIEKDILSLAEGSVRLCSLYDLLMANTERLFGRR